MGGLIGLVDLGVNIGVADERPDEDRVSREDVDEPGDTRDLGGDVGLVCGRATGGQAEDVGLGARVVDVCVRVEAAE